MTHGVSSETSDDSDRCDTCVTIVTGVTSDTLVSLGTPVTNSHTCKLVTQHTSLSVSNA